MIVRLLQHGCTCCSFVASGEAVLPVAEFAMAGGSQNSKIARSWGQNSNAAKGGLTSVTMQGGSRQTPMKSTTFGCLMADMMLTCS